MFFPFGDLPNPRGFFPWVTWLLIAANIAVYAVLTVPMSTVPVAPDDPRLLAWLNALGVTLASLPPDALAGVSAYDLFVFEHGFKPAVPSAADLLASMFLHSGLMHLLGNMLFLWIYGDNVEHRLGRLGALAAYLGTGAAAVLGHAVLNPTSMTPMVGASGAISGVLGMYFVMFPRNLVKVLLWILPFALRVQLVSARLVLGLYLVIDNLLPLLVGARGGVAYGAHIGGFVAGVALAWLGERRDWSLGRAPWGREPDDPDREALERALVRGDNAGAVQALRRLPREALDELPAAAVIALSRALEAQGQGWAAWRVLHERLAQRAGGDEQARVHQAMAELRLRQGQPSAAWHHLRSGFDLAQDEALAQAIRARMFEVQGGTAPGPAR